MILKVKDFQIACKKILDAVDTSAVNVMADILEVITNNNKLYLNVTNQEYYVSVCLDIDSTEELHAVVQAKLFLELISKITTTEVMLSLVDNYLLVEANGKYKFPLIYNNDKLIELQKISLGQVTNNLTISNEILQGILKYNSKELQKIGAKKPVQKMFYIDSLGAITFTSGACVNSFELGQDIKLLLSEKIVKLFKLFTSDIVNLTIGFDTVHNEIRNKVQFKTDNVELITIMPIDSSLINSVPVTAIRNMAKEVLAYNIVLDRNDLLSVLSRLSLFITDIYSHGINLEFHPDKVVIYDSKKENYETLNYLSNPIENLNYNCVLYLNDFKLTIETIPSSTVTIKFGNHRNILLE